MFSIIPGCIANNEMRWRKAIRQAEEATLWR